MTFIYERFLVSSLFFSFSSTICRVRDSNLWPLGQGYILYVNWAMLIVARVVSLENFFTFVFSTFWPLPLWIGFVLWSWCWRGTNELLWGLSSKSSFGGNHLIYGMLISWCPLSKSVTCSWGSCNCACFLLLWYFQKGWNHVFVH